jgi:hypothetical protein
MTTILQEFQEIRRDAANFNNLVGGSWNLFPTLVLSCLYVYDLFVVVYVPASNNLCVFMTDP